MYDAFVSWVVNQAEWRWLLPLLRSDGGAQAVVQLMEEQEARPPAPGWRWGAQRVPERTHDSYVYRVDERPAGVFHATRRLGGSGVVDGIGPGGSVTEKARPFKTQAAAIAAADALISKREQKAAGAQRTAAGAPRPALWDVVERPHDWPAGVAWHGTPVARFESPSTAASEADRAINDAITYYNYQTSAPLGRWLPLAVTHNGVTRKLEYLLPDHGLPRLRWPGHYSHYTFRGEPQPSWNLMWRMKDGSWVQADPAFIDRKPTDTFWGAPVDDGDVWTRFLAAVKDVDLWRGTSEFEAFSKDLRDAVAAPPRTLAWGLGWASHTAQGMARQLLAIGEPKAGRVASVPVTHALIKMYQRRALGLDAAIVQQASQDHHHRQDAGTLARWLDLNFQPLFPDADAMRGAVMESLTRLLGWEAYWDDETGWSREAKALVVKYGPKPQTPEEADIERYGPVDPEPADADRAYYVSARRGGDTVLLSGPYETHREAILAVRGVRDRVEKENLDPTGQASIGTVKAPRLTHVRWPTVMPEKGDLVEVLAKGETVVGKVVQVKKDGVVTVDVSDQHSDEDVGRVDVTAWRPAPATAPASVVTTSAVVRATASLDDLLADYKARGLTPQQAYNELIKDRGLRPDVGMPDLLKRYATTPARRLTGTSETVSFTPTHTYTVTGEQVQVTQLPAGNWRVLFPTGNTGGEPMGPLRPAYVPLGHGAMPSGFDTFGFVEPGSLSEEDAEVLEEEQLTEKLARRFMYGSTRKFGSRTYKFLLDTGVTRLVHPDGTRMVWSRPASFTPKLRHDGEMRDLAAVLFLNREEIEVWLATANGHPDKEARKRLWAGRVTPNGEVVRTHDEAAEAAPSAPAALAAPASPAPRQMNWGEKDYTERSAEIELIKARSAQPKVNWEIKPVAGGRYIVVGTYIPERGKPPTKLIERAAVSASGEIGDYADVGVFDEPQAKYAAKYGPGVLEARNWAYPELAYLLLPTGVSWKLLVLGAEDRVLSEGFIPPESEYEGTRVAAIKDILVRMANMLEPQPAAAPPPAAKPAPYLAPPKQMALDRLTALVARGKAAGMADDRLPKMPPSVYRTAEDLGEMADELEAEVRELEGRMSPTVARAQPGGAAVKGLRELNDAPNGATIVLRNDPTIGYVREGTSWFAAHLQRLSDGGFRWALDQTRRRRMVDMWAIVRDRDPADPYVWGAEAPSGEPEGMPREVVSEIQRLRTEARALREQDPDAINERWSPRKGVDRAADERQYTNQLAAKELDRQADAILDQYPSGAFAQALGRR